MKKKAKLLILGKNTLLKKYITVISGIKESLAVIRTDILILTVQVQ